jgi:hypothetical protein
LEERLVAQIMIEKEPDEMIFLKGFLWTKTADGHVIQIDPALNAVVRDIKVDTTKDLYHYCQGLGTDGEHIWACSASDDGEAKSIDVVRVDPVSASVVDTFKVGKIFDQLELPFLLDQIWVLTGIGDQLVGIDVTTRQPAAAIDLGSRCFQLAVVNNSLMAACTQDNLVLQIDPRQREVIRRIEIESPRFVAGDENSLWVAQDHSVLRLDLESLEPVAEISDLVDIGKSGDFFVTADSVWIRQKDGFLFRIDPASNEIVEQIRSSQPLSGGTVLVTDDAIWVTAYDDSLLFRLSRE